MSDLADKIEQAESGLQMNKVSSIYGGGDKNKETSQLGKVAKDSSKISVETAHGLMAQVIKNALFNKST